VSPVARIAVRLSPRADRDELVGIRGGVLHARVCAPPVGGEANLALCRLIARRAGVAPSRVRVIRGERGREKLVAAEGVEQPALLDALGA
jgi:uncharacterized protein YggU (UPF0235/DUF167 family)